MQELSRRQFLRTVSVAGASLACSRLPAAEPPPGPVAVATARPVELEKVMIPLPLDEPMDRSTIGSLYGPVSRIRDAYGWAEASFASERYAAEDYPAWRLRMLERVMESMDYRPGRADFAAEVVETVDRGTHLRQKLYFNTTSELRVPAYLLLPKDRPGRRPGVVALHDHGGFYRWGIQKLVHLDDEHPALTEFKQRSYAGRSIADDLAAEGYVVLVPEAFYWGERRVRLPDDPPTGAQETVEDVRMFNQSRAAMEHITARTIYSAGFSWAGVMFWDDLRALDYLAERPEVDPQRIGCAGLSMGAWRAAHLAAFDERIRAAVSVCWLSSYRDMQARHVVHTIGPSMLLPGIYRDLDMPDIVSLAAPRPLLCISALRDPLFPVETGVGPAQRTLEAVYGKLAAPERFRASMYDAPHEFNREMQQEAWAWLGRWLGG